MALHACCVLPPRRLLPPAVAETPAAACRRRDACWCRQNTAIALQQQVVVEYDRDQRVLPEGATSGVQMSAACSGGTASRRNTETKREDACGLQVPLQRCWRVAAGHCCRRRRRAAAAAAAAALQGPVRLGLAFVLQAAEDLQEWDIVLVDGPDGAPMLGRVSQVRLLSAGQGACDARLGRRHGSAGA